jgi:hypothetical protein
MATGTLGSASAPRGAPYRETTAEMLLRVTAAIDDRLAVEAEVAARLLPEVDDRRRARRKRRPGKTNRRPVDLRFPWGWSRGDLNP